MKSLQRLQQQILAQSVDLDRTFRLTPRAERLYKEVRKHSYSIVGGIAFGSAILLGPHSIDANAHATAQQRLYDKQHEILVAKENVISLKRLMIESPTITEKSLEELVWDLRKEKANIKKLEGELQTMTDAMADDEMKEIVAKEAPAVPPAMPPIKMKS